VGTPVQKQEERKRGEDSNGWRMEKGEHAQHHKKTTAKEGGKKNRGK